MAIELERLVLSAPHLHHVGSEQLSLPNLATAAFREWKRMNVEKVLRDYGQFLRPMNEAPRDGRRIVGQSGSVLVNCYWDINPSKLAGPPGLRTMTLITAISIGILVGGLTSRNSSYWIMPLSRD
jgi:hypothetical protein